MATKSELEQALQEAQSSLKQAQMEEAKASKASADAYGKVALDEFLALGAKASEAKAKVEAATRGVKKALDALEDLTRVARQEAFTPHRDAIQAIARKYLVDNKASLASIEGLDAINLEMPARFEVDGEGQFTPPVSAKGVGPLFKVARGVGKGGNGGVRKGTYRWPFKGADLSSRDFIATSEGRSHLGSGKVDEAIAHPESGAITRYALTLGASLGVTPTR